MMRSMYSGVAGLKTHQTKMDVIGNNIANVNTTAYKSSSVNFSELMYQTTSKASGPNATTGRAGVNPKQIGLGVQSAAISTKITSAGATQTTGNPFDIKINGEAFFIVSGDGTNNYFTRDGSFYVDAAGNLAMSANGYNVMGWKVDEDTQTIKKDTVTALRILSAANMTYEPEATTESFVEGILDRNEPDASTDSGKALNLGFYDALGYKYTAKFAIHETEYKGQYTVELADITNEYGESLVDVYGVNDIGDIVSFGDGEVTKTTELRPLMSGVHYTKDTQQTPPHIYTKDISLAEAFSDYDTKAVPGLTYGAYTVTIDANTGAITKTSSFANGGTTPTSSTFAKNDQIKLTGYGVLSREDMEQIHNMVYVESLPAGTAAPNGVNVPYYHITKTNADGTPAEYDLDATADADDWNSALGRTDLLSVSMDAEGTVTFYTKPVDFTAKDNGTYYEGANPGEGTFTLQIDQKEAYGLDSTDTNKTYTFDVAEDGQAQVTTTTSYEGYLLKFDVDSGEFDSIDGGDSVKIDFKASATTKAGDTVSLGSFSDINMDWSNVTWFNNGGSSTITADAGTEEKGLGEGRKQGQMSGVSISNNGEIYATYDNGMRRLLGQIAVAKFANAAGLEKAGDNLYAATQNSGEFDGTGVDVMADGVGSMTTGALEMSNVDLSAEFTEMITTQRGFQANSRIITVSDTLLEELVNLKR